jgi:hypothetical protein
VVDAERSSFYPAHVEDMQVLAVVLAAPPAAAHPEGAGDAQLKVQVGVAFPAFLREAEEGAQGLFGLLKNTSYYKNYYTTSTRQLDGVLRDSGGETLKRLPRGDADQLTLAEWAGAAGFSLEDASDKEGARRRPFCHKKGQLSQKGQLSH